MSAIFDDGDKSSPAGEINSVGVQEHSEVYAGICSASDPDGTLVVFVAEGADVSTFGARLAALTADDRITAKYRLTRVPRSYAELQRHTVAIAADKGIRSQGIKLASVSPDIDQNKIRIRLFGEYSSRSADYLINRYGRDLVTVDPVPQTSLPTFAI